VHTHAQGRGLVESEAQRHFAQIVNAIDYCHQLHVVHRDLKVCILACTPSPVALDYSPRMWCFLLHKAPSSSPTLAFRTCTVPASIFIHRAAVSHIRRQRYFLATNTTGRQLVRALRGVRARDTHTQMCGLLVSYCSCSSLDGYHSLKLMIRKHSLKYSTAATRFHNTCHKAVKSE
jgi:serine/threonine protein kinase